MDNSNILEILPLESWRGPFVAETQSRALQALETGKVVVLPHLPFTVEADETRFLAPSISGDARKNISFDPQTRKISNTALDQDGAAQLTAMMDRFGGQASQLLRDLIPSYASRLVRARTSYRPQEIEGRVYPPRQDDTRLHVDAFPSRPARGRRILRLFTNIAGDGAARRWCVGEPFPGFAQKFMPRIKPPLPGSSWLLERLGITKEKRSAYDHYMLALHDQGKLDAQYQKQATKTNVEFDAGATWFCFTDQVLHAALAGHAALEQTFYLPVEAMAAPSHSPLRVLEGLTGRALV